MAERPDEFYVGYLPEAPSGIARHTRWVVVLLLLLVTTVGVLLVTSQNPFPVATFEYLEYRDFEGTLLQRPYPRLLVDRPGQATEDVARRSSYWLVSFGKHGGGAALRGLDGHRLRLRGALNYRDNQTMLELQAGAAIEDLGPASISAPLNRSHGQQHLRGEIVDSKCYLGLMKPGHGKPHRGCAVRCISGGIPPIFVLRDENGPAAYLLLVGADGRAMHGEILDYVAEPLEIEGEVVRRGELWVLQAEPSSFRRLR